MNSVKNIGQHIFVDVIDDDRDIFGDLTIKLLPGHCFKSGSHSKSFKDPQNALNALNSNVNKCDCGNCLEKIKSRNLKPFRFKVTLCFEKSISINAKDLKDGLEGLKRHIRKTDDFTAINSNMDYLMISYNDQIVDYF